MRIAIPTWEGKVSPLMDTALRLLIVETEGQEEVSRFEIYLDEQGLSRRSLRIRGMKIDVLICGAISSEFLSMLMGFDFEIISEISGNVEEILRAYFQGTLFCESFLMSGCKRGRLKQRAPSVSCNRVRRKKAKAMRRNLRFKSV